MENSTTGFSFKKKGFRCFYNIKELIYYKVIWWQQVTYVTAYHAIPVNSQLINPSSLCHLIPKFPPIKIQSRGLAF